MIEVLGLRVCIGIGDWEGGLELGIGIEIGHWEMGLGIGIAIRDW